MQVRAHLDRLSVTTTVAGAVCLGGHVGPGAITSPWGWVGVGLLVESLCVAAAILLAGLSRRTSVELRGQERGL